MSVPRFFRMFWVMLLAGILGACATVPMAPQEQDARAKTFNVQPDRAALYIFRNENFGGALLIAVSVNGTTIGQTGPMTYIRLSLKPGKYSISSYGENVSTLSLNVEGGRNYYVWQEIKMGMWSARTMLQEVNENNGRSGVGECKLMATSAGMENLAPLGEQTESSHTATVQPEPTVPEKLRELQKLRNDGVVSEEEYQRKKKQLLENY